MGWIEEKQIANARKIDFEEVGFPEFWVKLADPQDYSAKQMMAINIETEELTEEELANLPKEEQEAYTVRLYEKILPFILEWNIPDPEGPKEAEPMPIEGESAYLLPLRMIRYLNREITSTIRELEEENPTQRSGPERRDTRRHSER